MEPLLDIEDIRALLPHRYPFLLVDRVLELRPGERVVGLKNVTINEPFFNGHFPGQAVMPGVLICEAMAQVAGLIILSMPEHTGKLAFLAKQNARFRIPVVPGDTLIIEATLGKIRSTIGEARAVVRVGGKVAAECDMTFALKPPPDDAHSTETKLQQIRDAIAAETESNPTLGTGDFADGTSRTTSTHHGRSPLTPALVAASGDRRD